MIKSRLFFTLHFIVVSLMLGSAYFLQYGLKMEPCPLCILERVLLIGAIAVSLLAILHNPQRLGQKIYASLTTLIALMGVGFSGRHLYLQSLPKDQIPECIPGFDYLIQNFPIYEVIQLIFKGSGQCAQTGPLLMGLSLAQWSLIAFLGLLIINLAFLVRTLKK